MADEDRVDAIAQSALEAVAAHFAGGGIVRASIAIDVTIIILARMVNAMVTAAEGEVCAGCMLTTVANRAADILGCSSHEADGALH